MLTMFVSKRCIFAMSKEVNDQLSNLASLFALLFAIHWIFYTPILSKVVLIFLMQSSNNLLSSSAHFAGWKTIFDGCIFQTKPQTAFPWQRVLKGLCRLLHRSARKSYFCILHNTYPIYVNSRLTASFCSELNRALPIRISLSRQSIVVVFEAIQNTRIACFIKSKTLGLRPRVFNLIKHCFSYFKYY